MTSINSSRPISTAEVLDLLRRVNPDRRLTESAIRGPIRDQRIERPPCISGVYIWYPRFVRALCEELGLNSPILTEPENPGVRENVANDLSRALTIERRPHNG